MLRLAPVVAERVAAGLVHPFIGADGVAERVGAPIARPHQILCIGLNYSDHAAESCMPVPDESILFTKSPNTLVGPHDDESGWAFQLERGGQWAKGTSAETFNPAGPWLVTPVTPDEFDEVDDVTNLGMWLDVNGQRRQTGSTSTMIFDPSRRTAADRRRATLTAVGDHRGNGRGSFRTLVVARGSQSCGTPPSRGPPQRGTGFAAIGGLTSACE